MVIELCLLAQVVDKFLSDHLLALFSLLTVFGALVDQPEKLLFGALFSR